MNKIFTDHVGDVVFSLLFFIKLSQASLGWAADLGQGLEFDFTFAK